MAALRDSSMQDYRKLRVHGKAHGLMLAVKRATLRFPQRGYGDLARQMTSAAESIPFNIVEGCGASSQRDFARFLDVSIKSSMELEYQLKVAMDYQVLDVPAGNAYGDQIVEVRRMLCGLRAKVLASPDSPPAPSPRPQSRPNRTTEQPGTQDASRTRPRRKAHESN